MPYRPKPAAARAILLLSVASLAIGAPLAAQSSPRGFSLPEPTPTPTPVPQGPVDVRSGVPLAPRAIPEESESAPAATPTPAITPVPDVIDAEVQDTPAPIEREIPADQPATDAPAVATPPPARTSPGAQAPEPEATDSAAPGFGEGSLYSGSDVVQPESNAETPAPPEVRVFDGSDAARFLNQPAWIAAIIAVLAALAGLIWWLARKRKDAPEPELAAPAAPAQQSMRAVEEEVLRAEPSADTASSAPQPITAPNPAKLDLRLDVISATRSVMRLCVEYRLTIANRSDRAARDIVVEPQLASAQSTAGFKPSSSPARPHTIERIGPHQSATLTGTIDLAWSDVNVIRQGNTPIIVPLMLVAVKAAHTPQKTQGFVLGTPSSSGQTRLHPIPANAPPGGIPDMRAQKISNKASPQAA